MACLPQLASQEPIVSGRRKSLFAWYVGAWDFHTQIVTYFYSSLEHRVQTKFSVGDVRQQLVCQHPQSVVRRQRWHRSSRLSPAFQDSLKSAANTCCDAECLTLWCQGTGHPSWHGSIRFGAMMDFLSHVRWRNCIRLRLFSVLTKKNTVQSRGSLQGLGFSTFSCHYMTSFSFSIRPYVTVVVLHPWWFVF